MEEETVVRMRMFLILMGNPGDYFRGNWEDKSGS